MSLPAEIPDVSGEVEYLRSMFIHGIKHLPCEWTPRGS